MGQGATAEGIASAALAARGADRIDLAATSLAELEEKAILAAVERASGTKVEAARGLDVTRQTPCNKLKTQDIEVRRGNRRTSGAA